METSLDYKNAEIYADHHSRVYFYNKFLKSHPHIFRYATLETKPATSRDYYIPPKIAQKCIVSKTFFNQKGCEKIACFPKKQNLDSCDPFQDTIALNLGNYHTLACQPACWQISNFLDTEFRNGKCLISNLYKKSFALFPEYVEGSKVAQPMHIGFDIKDGNLQINSSYCKFYGLDLKSSTMECHSTTHQALGEFFIGSSFYRSIQRSKYTHKKYPLPAIPDYMKDVQHWYEGTIPVLRKRRSTHQTVDVAMEILKSLVVDFGIDLTLDQMAKMFQKHIPEVLIRMSQTLHTSKYASKVIHFALADVIVKKQFQLTAQLSKLAGKSLQYASGVFTVYSIVSMIVDLLDPFEFNKVLDKSTLEKINKRLDYEFFKTHQNIVEITPEIIWFTFLSDNYDEYTLIKIEKMTEYLQALTPDTLAERSKYKKSTPLDFTHVYRSIIIVIFTFLGIVYVEYIAWVSLICFLFLLYIPSFYE